jgi:peptide/nickel transport system permease protein
MSIAGPSPRNATARGARRCAIAVPRIVSDFVANPVAIFGLVLLRDHPGARAVRAAHLAAESVRSGQLDVMDSRLPPDRVSQRRHLLARHRRPGRDMLSAIFYGLRISLGVGIAATVLALAIGLTMGLVAAYVGGRVENLIMRIVDISSRSRRS